jgi:hypothetical protein
MYKNEYNEGIVKKLNANIRNKIKREAEQQHMPEPQLTSQLEATILRDPEIKGGSGYAAATVADLGFEKTKGATSSGSNETSVFNNIAKPKRKYAKRRCLIACCY